MQNNQDSEIWLSYVSFIDGLIEETLFKSIACRYFFNYIYIFLKIENYFFLSDFLHIWKLF